MNITGTPLVEKVHGAYLAIVADNSDPLSMNRVQLNIPQIFGTSTSNWAKPFGVPSDSITPEKGSLVIAFFIGGDRNVPVYSPLFWKDIDTPVDITTNSAPETGIEIKVSGDSNERLIITGDGTFNWGSGSGSSDVNLYRASANNLKTDDNFNIAGKLMIQDTDLYRSAVNQLATDGAFLSNFVYYSPGTGTAETWHSLSPGNGWVNSGNGPDFQYRMIASPPNTVEIIGDLTGGTMTDGTVVATLPAGYRPATQQQVATVLPGTGATANMRFFVGTSGNIECEGMSALTTPRVTVHGFISLDA